VAGKTTQVSDLRALIEVQLLDVDDIVAKYGVSVSGLNMWTRGAVPVGAPPFPRPVKVAGKRLRLYLDVEVGPWITAHYKPRS
jgi:predicted DNA-binding transcriptional regulator AlpA